MIIQNILNFISDLVANVLGLVPPPPPLLNEALNGIQDAAANVEGIAAPLAPFIPFDALNGQLALWAALGVVYLGLIPLRVVFATMFFRPAAV